MDFKKAFIIFFVISLFSIAAVSAEDVDNSTAIVEDIANEPIDDIGVYEFKDISNKIHETDTPVAIDLNGATVKWNATGDEDISLVDGIRINKSVSISNGIIDGDKSARLFVIVGGSLTLNNVTLLNGNSNNAHTGTGVGGAIVNTGELKVVNSTFTGNSAASSGSSIYSQGGVTYIGDSTFVNNNVHWAEIYSSGGYLTVNNAVFDRINSNYSSAIYMTQGNLAVYNSNFTNLYANKTAGAIGVKIGNAIVVNSNFKNSSASKNGGAIYVDGSTFGSSSTSQIYIINSSFENCVSEFGGAVMALSSGVNITNTKFIDNSALYNGGAVYASCDDLNITDSQFIGNVALGDSTSEITELSGNGAALYVDYSNVIVNNTYFENNVALINGGSVYSYSSNALIMNSTFLDNSNFYSVFDNNVTLIDNNFNNDTVSLNNTVYYMVVDGRGITLELINSTVPVNISLDSFDLRDYGIVLPIRNQGSMGACWAFGSMAALESALLKATGVEYDFSENNMQNSMLMYSLFGSKLLSEGGSGISGAAYILAWLGAFPTEDDSYDELGKISPYLMSYFNVHVQNAVFIPTRDNFTDNDALKEAIMKYGYVTVYYYAASTAEEQLKYYNANTSSYYNYGQPAGNHYVSIVGWDDNYSKDNFAVAPPGDGAFILRNSWGSSYGEDGYFYISYYDVSLATSLSVAYLITNDTYDRNYQYDFSGLFDAQLMNTSYSNRFISIKDELISAVGTYFFDNENYTMDIYVNDQLVHTQSGESAFDGFNTIKLDNPIQISAGDVFEVVVTKDYFPFSEYFNTYLPEGVSFFYNKTSGEWVDLKEEDIIACIKVYTVTSSVVADDLEKYYKNESQFSATIVDNYGTPLSNVTVNITVNGVTYQRTSDENGAVSLNINLNPGNYLLTVFSPVDNKTYKFNIKVLSVISGEDLVKYYRNGSQYVVSVLDGDGSPLAGSVVTFNINGVFYTKVTDENGFATLNINLKPGKYIVTAITSNGLHISNSITVLSVISGEDLVKYYRNGSQYVVSVLDGDGSPLAGSVVTFNINGVFYTKVTDENGFATLNINLSPGEYIITAITSNGMYMSNSITVLPILEIMDYNNTSEELNIVTLSETGERLANQRVTININGVFTEAVSNDEGIAVFDNLNLSVGEYIVTAMANDCIISKTIAVQG